MFLDFKRLSVAVLMGLLLVGCSGRPRIQIGEEGWPQARADATQAAVVGVVIVPDLVPAVEDETPSPGAWAASLHGLLLGHGIAASVTPQPMVADAVDPGALAAVLDAHARRRGPSAAALAAVLDALPAVNTLALARLESDELEYRTRDRHDPPTEQREARPSDLVRKQDPPYPSTARRARRSDGVSLTLLDARSGEVLWEASVERRREIIIEHFSPATAGDLDVVTDEADGKPRIEAPRPDLTGLELDRLVDDALSGLVAAMTGPE